MVSYRYTSKVHLTTSKLEKPTLSQFCGLVFASEIKNDTWEQMEILVLLIACFVWGTDIPNSAELQEENYEQ